MPHPRPRAKVATQSNRLVYGLHCRKCQKIFPPRSYYRNAVDFSPTCRWNTIGCRCLIPLPTSSLITLQSILSSHFYLTTFLPLSHPQFYLAMLFRVWESINSYMYDERMLHFLSKLAEMHVVPDVSDPKRVVDIPDDERSEGEGRPEWSSQSTPAAGPWTGIYKDVGIFSDHEWNLLMCKCLASMGNVKSSPLLPCHSYSL